MKVTEICVTLACESPDGDPTFLAAVSLTLDNLLAVNGIKIIQGRSGIFAAMPDRPLKHHCPICRKVNSIKALFCNWCGGRLEPQEPSTLKRCFLDVVHPISTESRIWFETILLDAFEAERARSCTEGTVCPLPRRTCST